MNEIINDTKLIYICIVTGLIFANSRDLPMVQHLAARRYNKWRRLADTGPRTVHHQKYDWLEFQVFHAKLLVIKFHAFKALNLKKKKF